METLLWRRLDLPGHEACRLAPEGDGWRLSGCAVFLHEAAPVELHYRIDTDAAWRTTGAVLRGWIGDRPVQRRVETTDGVWRLDGAEAPAVAGCEDVDLGFSPSTNLLPIRRLGLALGESAEVRAAWLPFPALAFEPLPQVYTRLGETTYHYRSAGGRFERTLEVTSFGLVTHYPGLWEREGE